MNLEMPAIYRPNPGEDGSKFGWHKLEDLVTAVNNCMATQQLPCVYSGRDVVINYWSLFIFRLFHYWTNDQGMKATNQPEEIEFWENVYVPAGWGIVVIEAVKKGVVHVSMINQIVPVGWDARGRKVDVKKLVRQEMKQELKCP